MVILLLLSSYSLNPSGLCRAPSTPGTTKKRSSSYCFLLDTAAISFLVQLSEHSASIEESWDHTLPPQGHSQPEGAQTHILHLPCRPPLPPASEMHTAFLFSHWIFSLARSQKWIQADQGPKGSRKELSSIASQVKPLFFLTWMRIPWRFPLYLLQRHSAQNGPWRLRLNTDPWTTWEHWFALDL